jgi:hypothetical protein
VHAVRPVPSVGPIMRDDDPGLNLRYCCPRLSPVPWDRAVRSENDRASLRTGGLRSATHAVGNGRRRRSLIMCASPPTTWHLSCRTSRHMTRHRSPVRRRLAAGLRPVAPPAGWFMAHGAIRAGYAAMAPFLFLS